MSAFWEIIELLLYVANVCFFFFWKLIQNNYERHLKFQLGMRSLKLMQTYSGFKLMQTFSNNAN